MPRRIIKRFTLAVITSAIITNSYAVAPGLYLGIEEGPATNNANEQLAATASGTPRYIMAKPKSKQFGSRGFIGYKFNNYAGFEGGVNYFTSIDYDTGGVQTCSGATERVRNVDFVGKLDYSYRNSLGVYGKAGVAVTYLSTSGAFNSPSCKNIYNNKFNPTFTIGISYDLNQSWVADISWTRVPVGGIVSSVDFYGVGLSYHFVDRYCGQFLCDE